MTEQGPEYLEAIVEASKNLDISIEDLSQDQFIGYFGPDPSKRRKTDSLSNLDVIPESDWEKAKEFATIIDSASKQLAEKYRFNIDTSPEDSFRQRWKFGQFVAVNSRRRVAELSLLSTVICVLISIAILFFVTLVSKSVTFGEEIIPAVAIPLILAPIMSYIIFTQSYQLTQAMVILEDLSRIDSLTGLFNARFFTELVEMELAVASRYDFSSSLLVIDLDHFKKINESYGHLAGDEVIRIISNVIRGNVRRTDLVGRLGGEEFIVFLPHTNLEGAMIAADRVRGIISESEITFKDDRIDVTASVGVASTDIEVKNIEHLLQNAESALAIAKDKGRNLIECLPQISEESVNDSEVIEVQSS